MLRTASVSLLGGVVLLLAFLQWQLWPRPVPSPPVLSWDLAAPEVRTLADNGFATFPVPLTPFPAADYRFLQLDIEVPRSTLVVLAWHVAPQGRKLIYTLEYAAGGALWIDTRELRNWVGDIASLELLVAGAPGSEVTLHRFALHPPTLVNRLRTLYSDVTALIPWRRGSINFYPGVTTVSSYYPVPLALGLLVASGAAYGGLLLARRGRLRFDWQVVGSLFLVCWVLLDIVWQQRLFRQLADTAYNFAGKSMSERVAASPDGALFQFGAAAQAAIPPEGTRVFVTSTDEYTGLRSAYYLYPRNVYWDWLGTRGELPRRQLQPGDYIAVISPSPMRYAGKRGKLLSPGKPDITAELIVQHNDSSLYRVMR